MRRLFRPFRNPGWFYRHSAKFAGLVVGTLGTWVLALFLTVAITGEPVGPEPRPVVQVYFIE